MYTFEFDSAKSESNRSKHGMDFVEAQGLWNDSMLLPRPRMNRATSLSGGYMEGIGQPWLPTAVPIFD